MMSVESPLLYQTFEVIFEMNEMTDECAGSHETNRFLEITMRNFEVTVF
jgi:hypothetical protein